MTLSPPLSAVAHGSHPTSAARHARSDRLVVAAIVVVAAMLVVGVLLADARGLVPVSRSVPGVAATAGGARRGGRRDPAPRPRARLGVALSCRPAEPWFGSGPKLDLDLCGRPVVYRGDVQGAIDLVVWDLG